MIKEQKHMEDEVLDSRTNRYYSVSASPILHSDETVSMLTLFRDITEIKAVEENLRQARKMESIGTLTGGIAHDFNNILGIILGNTELALDDVPKWNPAYLNLEEIKDASLRAKKIVQQLLNFTRKTNHKLQPIELASVIKDSIKFLRSTIPTTIDFQQKIEATNETILGDPIQINQIMMNLCINAYHAMEDTGGILTVTVKPLFLDKKALEAYPCLKSGRHIKVMVSDTGPGIDAEIIDRIFDPYFTTKEVGKGSGMGLAVVQGLVKNCNGAISVKSKPGKGCVFSVIFPLVQNELTIKPATENELICGSETILFVDDERSITKVVKRLLEGLGYNVEAQINPEKALELFKSNPLEFDIVITDMTMPQMTGVTLSKKLMEIRPDLPVIICTGYSTIVDEKKARMLGIAAYVMKPIILTEMAEIIRKVLDKKS